MKYKYNNQWLDINIKALDSMPIGSIIAFAGTTIPNGWLECNGASITQSSYPDLYAIIGGTLPNMKGKVIVGQNTSDTDFDTLGETGGSKALVKHKHDVKYQSYPIVINRDASSSTTSGDRVVGFKTSDTTSTSELKTVDVGSNTADISKGNMPPYIVEKYIIKAFNVVPTMAGIVNANSTSTTDGYSCKYVNDKLEWKKGDSVTIGNGVGFGVTGGSGGACYVSIPLSKPINSSVSSATITINAGSSVRYEGNEVTISSFTLGEMFKEAGTLRIYTNNIQLPPHRIVGLFYNITITFS